MTSARAATGWSTVAAFAVTQTIGYGTLHYAFAVFLLPVAADLHAGTTAVTGAWTTGILTGAALAVPVGRWLDRRHGRALMTAGSLLGVLMLVAFSRVEHLWQLYLVQIGVGAAAAASLYEAAFAVLVDRFDAGRRASALLAVTVVAGFASTVFLPLTGGLVAAHGWRATLLVLAAVQAVTVPLHALAVRRPPDATAAPPRPATPAPRPAAPSRRVPHRPAGGGPDRPAGGGPDRPAGGGPDRPAGGGPDRPVRRGPVRVALGDRGFRLLVVAFTAHTAAVSALTVHLVAALVSWGHPPASAAGVAGLLGVLSVAGRLLTTGLQRRFRTTTVTATVFAVQAVAALAMPVVGGALAGAVGAVIGFGVGFGVATIAKPVLLAERYDVSHYATLAGLLVVPATLAKAAAPLAAAVVHTVTGAYTGVLVLVAVCCALAAGTLAASGNSR